MNGRISPIQKIVDSVKTPDGKTFFRVVWCDTWEVDTNLIKYQKYIDEYLNQQTIKIKEENTDEVVLDSSQIISDSSNETVITNASQQTINSDSSNGTVVTNTGNQMMNSDLINGSTTEVTEEISQHCRFCKAKEEIETCDISTQTESYYRTVSTQLSPLTHDTAIQTLTSQCSRGIQINLSAKPVKLQMKTSTHVAESKHRRISPKKDLIRSNQSKEDTGKSERYIEAVKKSPEKNDICSNGVLKTHNDNQQQYENTSRISSDVEPKTLNESVNENLKPMYFIVDDIKADVAADNYKVPSQLKRQHTKDVASNINVKKSKNTDIQCAKGKNEENMEPVITIEKLDIKKEPSQNCLHDEDKINDQFLSKYW